jgi:hypothetical protein
VVENDGYVKHVQRQSAATAPTPDDPQRLSQADELRQRPLTTFVPLDGKEKVYGSIP